MTEDEIFDVPERIADLFDRLVEAIGKQHRIKGEEARGAIWMAMAGAYSLGLTAGSLPVGERINWKKIPKRSQEILWIVCETDLAERLGDGCSHGALRWGGEDWRRVAITCDEDFSTNCDLDADGEPGFKDLDVIPLLSACALERGFEEPGMEGSAERDTYMLTPSWAGLFAYAEHCAEIGNPEPQKQVKKLFAEALSDGEELEAAAESTEDREQDMKAVVIGLPRGARGLKPANAAKLASTCLWDIEEEARRGFMHLCQIDIRCRQAGGRSAMLYAMRPDGETVWRSIEVGQDGKADSSGENVMFDPVLARVLIRAGFFTNLSVIYQGQSVEAISPTMQAVCFVAQQLAEQGDVGMQQGLASIIDRGQGGATVN